MPVHPRIESRGEVHPDPSDSLPLAPSPLVRSLWVAAGWIFLALGTIGIFLPVLPTTPFLLLTAACFARGSKRFYAWLLSNRLFGRYIRDWREHRSLPLKTKVMILILLWGAIIVTSLFFIPVTVGKIAIFAVPIGVTYYLSRIPTRNWAGEAAR